MSEYWILDPDLEVVRVYQRQETGYARARELSREAGDVLTSPFFPGLDLSLETIFRTPE